MIKVCVISGSTHAGGTTGLVVDKIAEFLGSRHAIGDVINVSDYDIKPCGRCGDCNTRTTPCDTADDAVDIMERMIAADAIIYAVPVHAFGMAHPMQIFLEKMGVGHLRFKRPLANKPAGAVVVGRRYNHVGVYNQLLNNILLNRMILVGSGYPAIINAGTPAEVDRDREGIEAVLAMVDRLCDFAHFKSNSANGNKWGQALDLSSTLFVRTENERVMNYSLPPLE